MITHLISRLVCVAIRAYQLLISSWLAPACRYHPTCSQYTYDAVEKYGASRGIWLGIKRISRCHPLGSSGYDPLK